MDIRLYGPRDGVDAAVGRRLRAVIGNLATRPDLHRNPLPSAKRTPAAWVLRIRLEESSFLPSRDDRSSSAAIVAGQSHRPMPGADIRLRVDGNTEFIAWDNPHATRLTLHILAAVAEHEREAISQRTKAAL